MASETPARVRFQDGAGLAGGDSDPMKEMWRASSVHSADIKGAPAPHTEKKPHNSNDPHCLL